MQDDSMPDAGVTYHCGDSEEGAESVSSDDYSEESGADSGEVDN